MEAWRERVLLRLPMCHVRLPLLGWWQVGRLTHGTWRLPELAGCLRAAGHVLRPQHCERCWSIDMLRLMGMLRKSVFTGPTVRDGGWDVLRRWRPRAASRHRAHSLCDSQAHLRHRTWFCIRPLMAYVVAVAGVSCAGRAVSQRP